MGLRALAAASAIVAFILSGGEPAHAADEPGLPPQLEEALQFELPPAGAQPGGWSGNPPGTAFSDNTIVHNGRQAVRLERTESSSGSLTTVTMVVPMAFAGKTLELHGFLRTEDVRGVAGLWLREDGDKPNLVLRNMNDQGLTGTTDWSHYSITAPVDSAGKSLVIGVLLNGTGKVWADDLELMVDGKPIRQAPVRSVAAIDREFERQSNIVIDTLTRVQVTNLALLGKVWGFLKYHHPAVTSGTHQWDFELFRVLPEILNAPSSATAQTALVKWIGRFGEVPVCGPCATLEGSVQLRPSLEWIADHRRLGEALSSELLKVYRNRVPGQQSYVGIAPETGKATFDREHDYPSVNSSDAGFRLLALYRYWNIIEYWFPYRDLIGKSWDQVLVEFLPRIVLAENTTAYRRELLALIASIHDSHANLWNGLEARPPTGDCQMPVEIRFVERRPVIVRTLSNLSASMLQPGDVIEAMDGQAVTALIRQWKPYYAASNEAAQLRDMSQYFTRGTCGKGVLRLRRKNRTFEVPLSRDIRLDKEPVRSPHDLPGDTFRLFSPNIAYLKLSTVRVADIQRYMTLARDADWLIVDIRGYPSEFVLYELGGWFVSAPTKFTRITRADLTNPGAFYWIPALELQPGTAPFPGKVLILVDETSQSQAEFTALGLRAGSRVRIVGSMTAGADGNVTRFRLPGDLRTMISGIGIFHVDGRPTQRVGIAPDIVVQPSIAGIREERDEVLERALREIIGEHATPADLAQLYRAEAGSAPSAPSDTGTH